MPQNQFRHPKMQLLALMRRDDNAGASEQWENGNSPLGHFVYNITSFVSILVVGILFGFRMRHLRLTDIRIMTPTRILVMNVYIFAMLFIFADSVITNGISLTTKSTCHSSIEVCLIFYFIVKGSVYVFLLERVYATRSNRLPRYKDWVWLTGIGIIGFWFVPMAVGSWGMNYSQVSMNDLSDEEMCVVGLQHWSLAVDLSGDICINVALTALFLFLLHPALKFRREQRRMQLRAAGGEMAMAAVDGSNNGYSTNHSTDHSTDNSHRSNIQIDQSGTDSQVQDTKASEISVSPPTTSISLSTAGTPPLLAMFTPAPIPARPQPSRSWQDRAAALLRRRQRQDDVLERLVRKSTIACILILIPTVVNLAVEVIYHGREQQWICMTICAIDICIQTVVIHWLTWNGLQEERS